MFDVLNVKSSFHLLLLTANNVCARCHKDKHHPKLYTYNSSHSTSFLNHSLYTQASPTLLIPSSFIFRICVCSSASHAFMPSVSSFFCLLRCFCSSLYSVQFPSFGISALSNAITISSISHGAQHVAHMSFP